MNLGFPLSALTIETGLTELCPDLHFDLPDRVAGGRFVMDSPRTAIANANMQGIYYKGNFVCAMDRNVSPEFKTWEEEDGLKEISVADADRHDEVQTLYFEVLPSDPTYHEALLRAQAKHDKYTLDDRGRVFRWQYIVPCRVRGAIIKLGWRNTFENLLRHRLPGITREALAEKFAVDLNKFPMGEPEEIRAALSQE
jgi:hypothetical protein